MRVEPINRRGFLTALGWTGAIGAVSQRGAAGHARRTGAGDVEVSTNTTWEDVRRLFDLRTDRTHMAGMVIASHWAVPSRCTSSLERPASRTASMR
jgi:hypothetical protein